MSKKVARVLVQHGLVSPPALFPELSDEVVIKMANDLLSLHSTTVHCNNRDEALCYLNGYIAGISTPKMVVQ